MKPEPLNREFQLHAGHALRLDDPSNLKDFQRWLKKNKSQKNEFSPQQIRRMKDAGKPFHSGYYEDQKIAGLAIQMKYGSADTPFSGTEFQIINMQAVEQIEITPHINKKILNEDDWIPNGYRIKRQMIDLR